MKGTVEVDLYRVPGQWPMWWEAYTPAISVQAMTRKGAIRKMRRTLIRAGTLRLDF